MAVGGIRMEKGEWKRDFRDRRVRISIDCGISPAAGRSVNAGIRNNPYFTPSMIHTKHATNVTCGVIGTRGLWRIPMIPATAESSRDLQHRRHFEEQVEVVGQPAVEPHAAAGMMRTLGR